MELTQKLFADVGFGEAEFLIRHDVQLDVLFQKILRHSPVLHLFSKNRKCECSMNQVIEIYEVYLLQTNVATGTRHQDESFGYSGPEIQLGGQFYGAQHVFGSITCVWIQEVKF